MSANIATNVRVLEEKLRANRRITTTEASALTGLPVEQSEIGLREMVNRYECQLQVTENGDLIYDFGGNLQRRGEKTLTEHLQALGEKIWLLFTYLFKAGITVTLLLYCLVFLVVLIALALASLKDSDDDNFSGGFDLIAHIFIAIFQWNTVSDVTYYETDRHGYRYRHYEPKSARKKDHEKGIIAAVYDFVFGPPRVETDELANLREAAAFIRRNNGILLTTDLKALAGWNARDAASFFAECIARFQGDIKVSSNGIMYGEFNQLTRTISEAKDSDIVYYWDEYEPEYQVTGNKESHNFIITAVNAFNLIMSAGVVGGLFGSLADWTVLLGGIPLAFSSLFFLIPAVRWLKVHYARERQHWHNIRRRVMRIIFEREGEAITINDMWQQVNNRNSREERLERDVVEKMLEQLKNELPGDIIYNNDGILMYAFPIIGMEMREARALRKSHRADRKLGKVVFDSEK